MSCFQSQGYRVGDTPQTEPHFLFFQVQKYNNLLDFPNRPAILFKSWTNLHLFVDFPAAIRAISASKEIIL